MLFGWHQVLETESQQQEPALEPTWFIQTKCDFLAKLVTLLQQDAIEGKQSHQQ